jgi:general secretion pathway protein E
MSTPVSTPVSDIKLPYSFAKKQGVILQLAGDQPQILFTELTKAPALVEAQRFVGQCCTLTKINSAEFQLKLRKTYDSNTDGSQVLADNIGDNLDLNALAEAIPETEDLMDQEDEAPIIRLLNSLLTEAIRQNASDIHIETFETKMSVRFRVDGILREVIQPKSALAPKLVSRIKVIAKLDIAEKRIPQDGRIALKVAGHEVDIRVSTMPASNGERIVLRLLDKKAGQLNLDALGMEPVLNERLSKLLLTPHGILLVTGPTGSGKTTTLYGGLQQIENGEKNILTIEDPIEYNLEGIGQTQVNTKTDMTFARGLRAMLRQDPDVVMVGEIRDLETAQIAIQASLTGHLVLSTLHTNTAIGAITRLEDMGVEPFLLSSSFIGVLAQRLVRVLCSDCKQGHTADTAECELLRIDSTKAPTIYKPVGCDNCNQQGYRGRTGIYELVTIDQKLRKLIHNHASEAELIQHARIANPSIFEDGKRKISLGETSIAEILRVTQEQGQV